MSEAKTYLQDELNQKIPQAIISDVLRTSIDKDEKVLALLGKKGLMDASNCILSTEDRIVYFSRLPGLPVKTFAILYVDLADVLLKAEGNNEFIYLLLNNGENKKIDIKASSEEIKRMFDFIQSYREQGAAYCEQKLQDEDYIWKAEAIRNHKSIKIASIHVNHDKNIEKNHEKYNDKFNRIASSDPFRHFRLEYCSGLGEGFAHGLTRITVNQVTQALEIKQGSLPDVSIPLTVLKGSQITTDVVIPHNDTENDYTFYIHINYAQDQSEMELVFSRRQKQNCSPDPIGQLHYCIQHIGERIAENNERNAHYDQRAQQLAEERVKILAQREGYIEGMRGAIQGVPVNAGQPLNQPVATPLPSSSVSPADEIKKYKELLDQGILTQEEFDAKKKQLLNL